MDVTEEDVPHPTTYMLTTVDNPFNPFTEWDEWYAYDQAKGYYTVELLGRIVLTSEEMSDADQLLAVEQGINDVLAMNDIGLYKKVSSES